MAADAVSGARWAEPILHVDMDSFYVEVERLEDPALIGRPVVVGGAGPRGVVASASYEAREFGVRSAQPMSTARRMCPQLIVVSPRHGRYGEVSADVFSIFRSITPRVEGLSLDEAFLDVSGLRLHFESPVEVADTIRSRLRAELGLPASVGIAAVKFVAKLASESAKPDGLRHVSVEEQERFLAALPASALWGVGPATQAALARLGVETIGDLAVLPLTSLSNAVGPTLGRQLLDLANGIDPRSVVPDSSAKSISVEETYDEDLESDHLVETALLAHSQRLSSRLRRAGVRGRTITLKVRFSDFATVTRSHTEPQGIDGARHIYQIAVELAAERGRPDPVRLLGLGASGLEPADTPAQLDISASESWNRVEDAVAEVRTKYGEMAVKPARLAGGGESDDSGINPDV